MSWNFASVLSQMLSWPLGSLRRKPSIDSYGEFRACRLSQINGAKIIFIQLPARVRFRFAQVHAVHRSKAWEPPGTISPNKSLCNHRHIGQKFWKRCEPPNLLNFSASNLYCFSLAHLVCYIFWSCALRDIHSTQPWLSYSWRSVIVIVNAYYVLLMFAYWGGNRMKTKI